MAYDTPWLNVTPTTTNANFFVTGGNRNTFTANKCLQTLALAASPYCFSIAGTSDGNLLAANTCQANAGSFATACYRLDAATVTNTQFQGWRGQDPISNNGGTFAITSGPPRRRSSRPPRPRTARPRLQRLHRGLPTASGGTGAIAIRAGGQWNGK